MWRRRTPGNILDFIPLDAGAAQFLEQSWIIAAAQGRDELSFTQENLFDS